ncbi:hypothetical protein NL676_019761 [Syzygium grande]|nr:hypothetical protein NL676_019761 [Syzygium grande]
MEEARVRSGGGAGAGAPRFRPPVNGISPVSILLFPPPSSSSSFQKHNLRDRNRNPNPPSSLPSLPSIVDDGGDGGRAPLTPLSLQTKGGGGMRL